MIATGRRAAKRAAVPGGPAPSGPLDERPITLGSEKTVPARDLLHVDFRAMGCQMSAWVATTDARVAERYLTAAWAFIRATERQLSRFLPDSELSRMNARPGVPVRVSPLLWRVLVAAVEAAGRTDGRYDPTLLTNLEAAGYDRTFEAVEDGPGSPRPAEPRGETWRNLKLDARSGTVTLPPGVRVDLGGIAKGWVAQRAADMLAPLGPCLVDAGGDIAAVGAPPGQRGWPIGVADPDDPETDLAVLAVRDRGVATSGIDYRRWRRGGRVQHHLIDPRSGQPAETDLSTVTVVAPDAAWADACALTAMLMGSRDGLDWLEGLEGGEEALLVCQDGRRLATSGLWRHLQENESARS